MQQKIGAQSKQKYWSIFLLSLALHFVHAHELTTVSFL